MAWVSEGQKFFQPRRYDKTKAQLVFRQQLVRLSRALVKNRDSASPGCPCKPPAAQIKTRRRGQAAGAIGRRLRAAPARLFLPSALLVAIRLQALPALVLVHLQAAFLFQVTHGLR
jgi:hypothetical protein